MSQSTLPRLFAGRTAQFDPEFYSVYGITRDGDILAPDGEYTPSCENDDTHDMLIDGVPRRDTGTDGWRALTGYTGQYGYAGAVMHASEQWGQWTVQALADIADNDDYAYVVFALVSVEAPCTSDEPCFPDEPSHCETYGCDAPPAGWAVIYRGVSA